MKVFPAGLINGNKVPLIGGWREKATNDPNQIAAWQQQYGSHIAFWGVPMGIDNGMFALDIDVKKENGYETLKKYGFTVPITQSQRTMTGGQHFFFKHDPSREIGNKVGFLPGLDIRSSGGWIAFYGHEYDPSAPLADAPEWVYSHATRRQRETEVAQISSAVGVSKEIAERQFNDCITAIREAAPGEGNNVLNIEAFKVGQLVASGAIAREFAELELFKAAKERGRPDYEARATIKSGLDGGAKNPLTSPFTNAPPVMVTEVPPPPSAPSRWTPRRFTIDDFNNTSKLKKPQLFKDWSVEDITLVTADGGTGKTTMYLNEAICLALGIPFMGFHNVQRGNTLYITGEDTVEKLGAMMGQILRQMQILGVPGQEHLVKLVQESVVVKKDSDLCLIFKDGKQFLHPNKDALSKVKEAIDDLKPKQIIFDPISSFWGSEASLNDMNRAVNRFMSEISEYAQASVVMINHMGKSSSAAKDVSQFAGRGGSGLVSNARVARVMHAMTSEEFVEATGSELPQDQTAMQITINKFSDGSPLLGKPFIAIRDRFMFTRLTLSPVREKQLEKQVGDKERVFAWIKELREAGKYPTKSVITGWFLNCGDPMSAARVTRAIDACVYHGHADEFARFVDNPDLTIKDKVLVIVGKDEREI